MLKNIVGSLKKVVSSAFGIFRLAKPLLEKLGIGIDEIEKVMEKTQELLDSGEAELKDDFIDANIDTVIALENVSGKGAALFQQLNGICGKMRVYSQEMTPDQITAAESDDIEARCKTFLELLKGWKPEMEDTIKLLAKID